MADSDTSDARIEIAVNKVVFSTFADTHVYEEIAIAGFNRAYLLVTDTSIAPVELYGRKDSNFYQFLVLNYFVKPNDAVAVIIIVKHLLLVVCDTFNTVPEFDIYSETSRQAYNDMINFYYGHVDRRLSQCIIYKHGEATPEGVHATLVVVDTYIVNSIRSAISLDEMDYGVVSLAFYGLILEAGKKQKISNDSLFDAKLFHIMKQLCLYNKKSIFDETPSMIRVYIEEEIDLVSMLDSAISESIITYKTVPEGDILTKDILQNANAEYVNKDIQQFIDSNNLIKMATIVNIVSPNSSSVLKLNIDLTSGHIVSNLKNDVEPDDESKIYLKYAADTRSDSQTRHTTNRLDFNQVTYNTSNAKSHIKCAAEFLPVLTLSPQKLSTHITNPAAEDVVEDAGADSGQNQPASEDVIVMIQFIRGLPERTTISVQSLHKRICDFDDYSADIVYPKHLAFVLTSTADELDVAMAITQDAPADPVFLTECFKRHYLLKASYNSSVTKMLLVVNIIISTDQSAPVVQFTAIHASTQMNVMYFNKDYINSIVHSILYDITYKKLVYMFENKSKTHYLPKFVVSKTIELFLNRCTIILDYARNFDKATEFYISDIAEELRFIYVDYYEPPVLGLAPGVNRYSTHIHKHYQLILSGLQLSTEIYVSAKSVDNTLIFHRINEIAVNYDIIQLHLLDKVMYGIEHLIEEDGPVDYISSDIIDALSDDIEIPDRNKHQADIADLVRGPSNCDNCEFTRLNYTTLLSTISMRYITLNGKGSGMTSMAKKIWNKISDEDDRYKAETIKEITQSLTGANKTFNEITNKLSILSTDTATVSDVLKNRPEEVYNIANSCGLWQELTLDEFKSIIDSVISHVPNKK